MKYFVLVALLVGLSASFANAGAIVIDFDGQSALTPDHPLETQQGNIGWARTYNPGGDPATKSQDWSYGNSTNDGPTALKVLDQNQQLNGAVGNSYMKTYSANAENMGGGVLFMAKMRVWDTSGTDGGSGVYGFGVSSTDLGKSAVIGFGKTAGGTQTIRVANAEDRGANAMLTLAYGPWITMAFRINANGTLDAWYTGEDWNGVSANWTQFQTGGALGQTMKRGEDGSSVNGLVGGGFANSGGTCNYSVDWLAMQTGVANPWDWDPFYVEPPATPEPGSLLALGSGLIGMAGFALRRRRA